MTNEQQPADQGRGVGEGVSVPMILWAMRNWADVADRCAVTEGHAPSCIRTWADLLEAALAALTQPKDELLWVIGQARALLGKVLKCDTVNNLHNVEKLIAFMDARGYKSADKIEAALSLPRQSEAAIACWRLRWPDGHTSANWSGSPIPPDRVAWFEAEGFKVELAYTFLTCSCPSGDGSLNWPCKAHPPTTPPAAQAGTTPAAHGVGDGMVVVPAEPTEAMMEAWGNATFHIEEEQTWRNAYADMIAAGAVDEPSQEMIQAGYEAMRTDNVIDSSEQGRVRRIYAAMLQAASTPGGPTHEESK